MARFDVYKGAKAKGFLLDCQSDLLDEFGSRVVVPLMPTGNVQTVSRLHPVFVIQGMPHIMSTHLIFAIPLERLGGKVESLTHEHLTITSALDMLFSGY